MDFKEGKPQYTKKVEERSAVVKMNRNKVEEPDMIVIEMLVT